MQTANRDGAIRLFVGTGGFLFFSFGVLAIILRITQFLVLGDPPLEILVQSKEYLYLQGVPSLVVAVFFLLGATALYLQQADQLGWVGLTSPQGITAMISLQQKTDLSEHAR